MEPDAREQITRQCRSIRAEKDYWIALERLRGVFGETSYRDTIRQILQPAPSVAIPEIYDLIWSMRIGGLINLNIDRLATRARQRFTEAAVIEFNGRNISDYLHVLKSPQPFILNLHGIHEDYSSWVFTRSELGELKKTPGYTDFLRTCLLTSTVIFVGISADDESVGGHLKQLSSITKDIGPHYWITDRRDIATDNWAEQLGIRIIRYESSIDNHASVGELFDDLLSYIPQDEIAPPVEPKAVPEGSVEISDPQELLRMESEEIRRVLNQKAKEILSSGDSAYHEYSAFFEKYDEAIYRAWFTSDADGANSLLGFSLEKLEAKGAFGKVYRARGRMGEELAIKVLLEEERRRSEFLQSFRRGVRSMRILSDHGIHGVVVYKEAYEIPAFVVMDWVDGPNLDKAIRSKMIVSWLDILRVAKDLTTIIDNAHRVPERVLHRDIRPANIMLEGLYGESSLSWRVVVLDFDLSWHLGASEKSVVALGTTNGYLSPEQIHPDAKISTRHSSVDSFGLGMTMFFMVSKRDPFPAENMHRDWDTIVKQACECLKTPRLRSLPARFARIILNTTKVRQAERWDLSQIKSELERLYDAFQDTSRIESAELIAEEIIARTGRDYRWNGDKLSADLASLTGSRISLTGHESKKQIVFSLEWTYQGDDTYAKFFKRLDKSFQDIKQQLQAAEWIVDDKSKSGQSLVFRAHLAVGRAVGHVDELAANLNHVLNTISKLTSA